MTDREKVIGHLNNCVKASRRDSKWIMVHKDIVNDALALLKEQKEDKRMVNKPLNYMGYDVTTIEDPDLGSFHYDKHHNLIDWESADRLDELSVSVDALKAFLHKAEEIFAILGVDVND